jgi:hypothetical protein
MIREPTAANAQEVTESSVRPPLVNMDIIGDRGEALFRVAITKWCSGKQWFQAAFLGEKAEGLDFEVVLLNSTIFRALCYVQVKATARPSRYSGMGKSRRLMVRLKKADANKLGRMRLPAYVVGIDVLSGAAYIRHVPAGSRTGFEGISCRRQLDCPAIRTMWNEVEAFWKSMSTGLETSAFED